MLAIEEIMCELVGEEMNEQGLPPGFRFHPTDEELITFYLASKVFNGTFCGVDVAEVDLNRCEPWELPEVAKMGKKEWYFFSSRDRKYPTGLRTNRATGSGYWKATGKDKEVYSSGSGRGLLGMKKTLVFYKGRAPRGEKTKWVMHEYRLDGDFSYRHTCKEEWVICRIFQKMRERKLQNYPQLLEEESSSPNTKLLPSSLLHYSTTPLMQSPLQNPFLFGNNHQSQDLKSLINPLGISSSSSSTTNPCIQTPPMNPNNKDSTNAAASLVKSLPLSNQDYCFPTIPVPKQCMTEASFSSISHHLQMPDANLRSWGAADKLTIHKHHQTSSNCYYENPSLLFGQYFDAIEFSTSAAGDGGTRSGAGDTRGLYRGAFDQMVLPGIKVAADSWPLDV